MTSLLEDCRQTVIYWDRGGLPVAGGNTASSDSVVMIPEIRIVVVVLGLYLQDSASVLSLIQKTGVA